MRRRVGLGFVLLLVGCVGCAGGSEAEFEGSGSVDTGAGETDDDGATTEGGSEAGDDTGGEAGDDGGADTAIGDGGDDAGDDGATEAGADADDAAADGDDAAVDTGPDDTGAVDTGPADTFVDPCPTLTCSTDTDGDGIPDTIEGRCAPGGPTDTDKDGTPDYLDSDSDGDGIPDAAEWIVAGCDPSGGNDADGDGVPNFRDLDSDGNGLADKDEACPPAAVLSKLGMAACSPTKPYDFDGDGTPDFLDPDNDHDSASTLKELGLDDKFELTDATGAYVGLSLDADGDGIPDVYDRDSDNDGIFDLEDGLSDVDKDGKQNFRDTDSDGDGVPDSCEKLVDTDGDGKADYVDLDSDGDLLLDGAEDKNGNCAVNAGETDRLKKDSDGDGVDDFIETTLDTGGAGWATNPSMSPAKAGKFYFVVPYSSDGSKAPSPTKQLLALSTTLNKGDVGFVVDTTGSMGGEISNLKSSLSSIFSSLKARIPDLGIGVAAHDDYPFYKCTSSSWLGCSASVDYGSPSWGDKPYYITSSGYVTTSLATAQSAANALTTHNGNDWPESQIHAYYKAITGAALCWPAGDSGYPSGCVANDAPASTASTFGSMRFRKDALPILVGITDASFHDGKRALNKTGTSYDSSNQHAYISGFPPYRSDELVAKLKELGAKFVGISSDDGARAMGLNDPYGFLAYITDKSDSNVPPSAFPGGTCKTGVGGATVAADGPGGLCRSVYSINTTGSGLSTSIVDGVYAILASIKFDVYVQAYDDPGDTVDAVNAFVSKVEPQPAGGTDPVTGGTCVSFPSTDRDDRFVGPKALTSGADGVFDTIKQVNPGKLHCFDVVPKPNTSVPATNSAQTFKAWLRVLAQKPTGGTFTLGSDREVLFVVPPIAN